MSALKTFTKKQLIEALAELPDDAKIEFTLDATELNKAKENGFYVNDGMNIEQYSFGLPGDAGLDSEGIAFMLWATSESNQ